MTRVGGSDQVLLLLREQLQRIGRARSARTGGAGARREVTATPLARLRGLAALDQLSDDDFRRTLVRAVLTEELGDAVGNDPSFQAVVDDVFRILSESEEGRALIDGAARQLRPES